MDFIVKRDWWSTMRLGVVCAALGLLGAIIAGVI